jgi:GNAT superfamily N-acetyltransferase
MELGHWIIQAKTPQEIQQARELFHEYGASLGFSLCFQSFEQELAGLPGVYAPPEGSLLLGVLDEDIAGCVALRRLEDTVCEMKRLYVRPQFRGKGIGRDLVLSIVEEARRRHYLKMRLDTIASVMKDAVMLYRSLGFQEIAPYTYNPIPGAICMEFDLADQSRRTCDKS